jgi:exodeoxyribonuclease V alpha subunit
MTVDLSSDEPDRFLATTSTLRELCGVAERISFQSLETGFTVARPAPERRADAPPVQGEDRLVTLVGTLAGLTPGEAIVAQGLWLNSPEHGWKFLVRDYRTTCPPRSRGCAGNRAVAW